MNEFSDNYRSSNNFNSEQKNKAEKHEKIEIDENSRESKQKDQNQKLMFLKFLINVTKVENNYDQFYQHLFWCSIIECFLFLCQIGVSFFSGLILLLMLFHISRPVLGFIIICKLPMTNKIIDELSDIENCSIDEVSSKINTSFKSLVEEASNKAQCWIILYFINTVLNIAIDIIVFTYLSIVLRSSDFDFGGLLLFAIPIYLFSLGLNISYFTWMTVLKYSFNDEIVGSIRLMTIGCFENVKSKFIVSGANLMVKLKGAVKKTNTQTIGEQEAKK